MERVSTADVAGAAGVSVATVSYVPSGKRPVRPETRAAVEAAVQQLGFTLDTAARSLRTGRSSLVGLVVPDLATPFFAQLAAVLQEHLRDLGRHVVVCDRRADRREELAFVREAVQQRFAGVVITATMFAIALTGLLSDAVGRILLRRAAGAGRPRGRPGVTDHDLGS